MPGRETQRYSRCLTWKLQKLRLCLSEHRRLKAGQNCQQLNLFMVRMVENGYELQSEPACAVRSLEIEMSSKMDIN